jgi:hypothetical protein
MTGEKGGYTTRGGAWVPHEYNVPGAREGDLHPFETLDIPPDLMFMRPQGEDPISPPLSGAGKFPPEGKFDWLFLPPGVSRHRG